MRFWLFILLSLAFYTGYVCAVECNFKPANVKDIASIDNFVRTRCVNATRFLADNPTVFLDFSAATQIQIDRWLKDVTILGIGIRLVGSSLTQLDLSKMIMYIGNSDQDWSLEIEGNLVLTKIKLNSDVKLLSKKGFKIQGNPSLDNDSLNTIRQVLAISKNTGKQAYSFLQALGECSFPNGVSDLSLLDRCQFINGDLTVNADATGNVTALKRVTGCITIIGTNISSIGFLNNTIAGYCPTGNRVFNNSNLCIKGPFLQNKALDLEFQYNSNGCAFVCIARRFLNSRRDMCEVVNGDVIIEGRRLGEDLTHLQSVQAIHGRLIIQGNEFDEVYFPNLVGVTTVAFAPAITIVQNNGLKALNLPKLRHAVSQGPTRIRVEENGQFKVSWADVMDWSKKFTLDKMRVDSSYIRNAQINLGIPVEEVKPVYIRNALDETGICVLYLTSLFISVVGFNVILLKLYEIREFDAMENVKWANLVDTLEENDVLANGPRDFLPPSSSDEDDDDKDE